MLSSSQSAILRVVGAGPNFMKAAPVMAALRELSTPIPIRLVHTGQHCDEGMKDAFLQQLGISEPDVDLGVGSGNHADHRPVATRESGRTKGGLNEC